MKGISRRFSKGMSRVHFKRISKVQIKGIGNVQIKRAICVLMLCALALSALTGCSSGGSGDYALDKSISLKEQNGSLPDKGTVGSYDYVIHNDDNTIYNAKAGYYIDMLDQMDSPYFYRITLGSKAKKIVKIIDIGMDGSTLKVLIDVVGSSDNSLAKNEAQCCVLELKTQPKNIDIRDTKGRKYDLQEW